MIKKTGIYKISNKEDGKIYIGQAKNIDRRWREHKRTKYPEDQYSYEILMECDLEQLNFWEIAWITSENACDPNVGYNKTLGGTSLKTIIPSDEVKAKIGAARKGKKFTDEHKAKMSAAQKGRKHTDETRTKISLAGKGRKGLKTFLGRTHTDETKAKLSTANIGKKLTEEQRDKLRKPCVINGIKYLGADVAADALGINVKTLRAYLTSHNEWPAGMSGHYLDKKS